MRSAIFIDTTDAPSLDDLGLLASVGYRTVMIGLDAGVELLRAAADQFDIDLDTSWLLGRTRGQIEVGLGVGCSTVLLDGADLDPITRAMSHVLARDFADAAAKIESRRASL